MAASAIADVVYIRDTLYVPLRGGQSNEHRILHRGLRSGTSLERLEDYSETGYSRVRMEDGKEGYIQTQYLTTEPIAKTQLETLGARLLDLEAKYQQSLLRIQEAEDENNRLQTANAEQQQQLTDLGRQYAALEQLSSEAVALDAENKRIKAEREQLDGAVEVLQSSNAALQSDATQRWFLSGGGVVLMGLLFGFWLARRLYRRESSW